MQVLALVLLVAAMVAGGVRAVALAHGSPDDPLTLPMDGAAVQVTGVEEVTGVAAKDLMSGMGHNISGYVSQDQMMISVALRLRAGGDGATYDVRRLVAHASGNKATLHPAGGSLGSGVLSAHAQVEGSVTFVVPRNGAHLVLGVRGSPRTVDLASVDTAAPAAPDGHSHHGG